MIFEISYDLDGGDGEDYNYLIQFITTFFAGRCLHLQDSTWLIGFDRDQLVFGPSPTAEGLKRTFSKHMTKEHSLFVTEINPANTSYTYDDPNVLSNFFARFSR